MKKQLEGRWKNINEKLRAQEAPEYDDAAALRKYVFTLTEAGGGKTGSAEVFALHASLSTA